MPNGGVITARVARELLRRVELAQASMDKVHSYATDDAREHLEHVRLTLVGAIASSEQLAGRDLGDVR